jgi:hypothetical protein
LWRCHYEATGTALDAAAIRSTLDLLEARALFDAPERAVYVRVAEHADHIYLDLGDEGWRAVEIGPDGWRVLDSHQSGFVGRPECCRFLPQSEAARSKRSPPSSTYQVETTLC